MTSTGVRVVTARAVFAGPGLQVNGLEAVPEGLWLSDQRELPGQLEAAAGVDQQRLAAGRGDQQPERRAPRRQRRARPQQGDFHVGYCLPTPWGRLTTEITETTETRVESPTSTHTL